MAVSPVIRLDRSVRIPRRHRERSEATQGHATIWERAVLDVLLRLTVQEALDDPRPAIPAVEVFAALRAHHAERMKAAKLDA
ncbi:hypothetical protein [Methylobacterium sp. WL7]|uniref:hypothetical protein n=1 Tax=Methylobacterium sp. WL7 TaxID=2603900 RepID=UPI0016500AA9|nr:hypothetical protein [Methylobacterium sp. WL7]